MLSVSNINDPPDYCHEGLGTWYVIEPQIKKNLLADRS